TATNVPNIDYQSVPNFLTPPKDETPGESVAVATNSKGHVFLYHRSANTRLWEFDQNGKFVKEIGKGYYGFAFAHSVRVDPQDNIFVSDGYCNNRVVKYDKNGRFLAKAGSEKAGKGLGEFNLPHGLQVDGQGNVWVADRSNFRYQVLDNNLKPIKEYTNLGV